jgi:hypothetical protein
MLLAGVALGLAVTSAAAGTRQPLAEQLAAFDVPAPSPPFQDAVIEGANRPLARTAASAESHRYAVGDAQGSSVSIEVSAQCAPTILLGIVLPGGCNPPPDPAGLAGFLGSLPHGNELDLLSVLMATQAEITSICGANALACYFPDSNRMVVRGNSSPPAGGVSRDFVVAHEYGHHLAHHRNNEPWDALSWGPKRWAMFERICQGVAAGSYYPGDQGVHYFDNPGEAFAEAFAFARFPNETAWLWTESLRPSAPAFEKIRADAVDPWQSRKLVRWHGRLWQGVHSVTRVFATPLDGLFTVRLRSARGTNLKLVLVNPGGRRGAARLSRRSPVRFTICGQAGVRVRVVGRKGAGRFTVRVLRP